MNENNVNRPSDALFREIVETAKHPKRREAIDYIKRACDFLGDKNIEISVSEVGRLCEKSGPKVQSIHNNKEFKAYIRARRAEQKLFVDPNQKAPFYGTDDPQATALLYAFDAKARRSQLQKECLMRALADAGEYDLDATMRTGKLVRVTAEITQCDPVIADVLRRFLDQEHLRKFGLNVQRGRIIAVDRNDRVFIEKGDLERLLHFCQGARTALP